MAENISMYSLAVQLRSFLKQIQQLSWDITQFHRKFPLEEMDDTNYQEIIDRYRTFLDDVEAVAKNYATMKKDLDK